MRPKAIIEVSNLGYWAALIWDGKVLVSAICKSLRDAELFIVEKRELVEQQHLAAKYLEAKLNG